MAKKGESKIDTTRNLCDSCKFNYPDCDGDPEFGDNISNDNIIKCKQYRKTDKVYKRVGKGEVYWWFNYFHKVIKQVEQNSIFDSIRSEAGNYFYTEEDCVEGIDKAKEYQRNKKII